MYKLIVTILIIAFMTSCSGGDGISTAEAERAVRGYYTEHPYMLGYPDENTGVSADAIKAGYGTPHSMFGEYGDIESKKHKADIKEIKVLKFGKKATDGRVPIKCLVIGQNIEPNGANKGIRKEVVFYLGKDDFGNTTLQDEWHLRSIVENK